MCRHLGGHEKCPISCSASAGRNFFASETTSFLQVCTINLPMKPRGARRCAFQPGCVPVTPGIKASDQRLVGFRVLKK
jgi:hypothetical protein